jgi:hypothetical protein
VIGIFGMQNTEILYIKLKAIQVPAAGKLYWLNFRNFFRKSALSKDFAKQRCFVPCIQQLTGRKQYMNYTRA